MSLQTLLAKYPRYSARKIRRLAQQLELLDQIVDPLTKSIADDLIEFHLMKAEEDHVLNDDVNNPYGPRLIGRHPALDAPYGQADKNRPTVAVQASLPLNETSTDVD